MDIDRSRNRLDAHLRRWSLSSPKEIATTPSSRIYKVTLSDGRPAALKCLTPRGAEEAIGAAYLDWRDGSGAARLIASDNDAMVIEWLDGPSLGDLTRAGQIDETMAVLRALISRLHAPGPSAPDALTPLATRFRTLLSLDPGRVVVPLRPLMERSRHEARSCLAGSRQAIPLHGDLHHDNILRGDRGWLAFDPKGVLGDPAYDLANLFINPVGAPELATDLSYHQRLAHELAPLVRVDPMTLRQWAVAHAGLSMAWCLDDDGRIPDAAAPILTALIGGLDREREGA